MFPFSKFTLLYLVYFVWIISITPTLARLDTCSMGLFLNPQKSIPQPGTCLWNLLDSRLTRKTIRVGNSIYTVLGVSVTKLLIDNHEIMRKKNNYVLNWILTLSQFVQSQSPSENFQNSNVQGHLMSTIVRLKPSSLLILFCVCFYLLEELRCSNYKL